MKINVQKHNWNEINISEIAQLLLSTRKASPFWRPDWNLDWFHQFIQQRIKRFSPSFVILARVRENLVGMIGIITADPTLYDLWRWHPVVFPGKNENEIAVKLITDSIQHMQAAGVHRLEVGFDFNKDLLTRETEAYYQKYSGWYEVAGAAKLDEFVYMTCQACDFKSPSQSRLQNQFEIKSLNIREKK